LFADDDFGINRQCAAGAPGRGTKAKPNVTQCREAGDAIEQAIGQGIENELATKIDGQIIQPDVNFIDAADAEQFLTAVQRGASLNEQTRPRSSINCVYKPGRLLSIAHHRQHHDLRAPRDDVVYFRNALQIPRIHPRLNARDEQRGAEPIDIGGIMIGKKKLATALAFGFSQLFEINHDAIDSGVLSPASKEALVRNYG